MAERSRDQLVRYLAVGALNTGVGYLAFVACNLALDGAIPHAYLVANLAANVVAITVAFLGYKLFVFRTRGNWAAEYLRTYVVYGGTILLGLVLLPALVAIARRVLPDAALAPYVAQAVLIPITVLSSFLGHKRFSFRSGGRLA
jgi:putative flippase GtrA